MPRTVLVVDDNATNRMTLEGILGAEYDIIDAENGQEASNILMTRYPQISAVLLDIIMPVMDGYGVLEKMRANPVLSRIPVIVTTGDSDIGAEKKAFALGANDFVSKPYDADILKRRLDNLIRLRETSALFNVYRRDKLTQLWNREAFIEKAEWEIAKKPEGYFILGCVDIDGFKVINDRYGTAMGDDVIKTLGALLSDSCEKNGGLCGRVTADQFVCLYPKTLAEEGVIGPMKLEEGIREKFPLYITLSVGRYIVDDKSIPVGAMYDRARLAQNTVKGRFDVRVAMFDESMLEKLIRDREITNEMNSALASGQFEVWYQPQYNHATGASIGAEALVRWRHPKRGLISPAEFIPVFENNGFIYELDRFVWEEVCKNLRRWLDERRDPLPVSVNISRCDLFREDLIASLVDLTDKYRLPEELLRLEITESAFSKSTDQVVGVVKKLVARGFTVEIDDFGSGYSSLNILKDVPAEMIKLDMRFMEGSDSDRGGNILESVVRMAKWLDMSVIAEGVEETSQADFLMSIGCRYVQGYLYAHPMPLSEYETIAPISGKERELVALETVENLDNNAFWDPSSMDTLIFNSYVGAACIFEYRSGRMEVIRSTARFAEVFGGDSMTIDDTLRLDWNEHLTCESRSLLSKLVSRSIDTSKDQTGELVFEDLPGCPKRTYIRAVARVIATAGDHCLVYALAENITAQREAEKNEREAAARLSDIMENIDAGVSAVTISGGNINFIFANERYYSMLGYTRDEFRTEVSNVADLIYEEDRETALNIASSVVENKKNTGFEYRCVKRNGDVIWLRYNATYTTIDGVSDTVLLSIATDITSEKLAEQKLVEAYGQLRLLNELSADLLAQPEIGSGIEKVLGKILVYFGASRAYIMECDSKSRTSSNTYEVCRDSVPSLMDERHCIPRAVCSYWVNAFSRDECVNIEDISEIPDEFSDEKDILLDSGISSIVSVPFHRDGVLVGFIGLDDPTERQAQAEQLRALGDYLAVMLTRRDLTLKIENDAKTLRTLMDDTPGGFVRIHVRQDGTLSTVYVNSSFCRMRMMSEDEILNADRDNALVAMHPDDLEPSLAVLQNILQTGEKKHTVYRLLRSDGSYIPLNAYGSITKNELDETFLNIYYTELSSQSKRDLSMREAMPFILSTIMEASNDYAFAKDRKFRYLCASPAFLSIAGKTYESEVVGKTDFDLFPKETAEQFRRNDIELFSGGSPLVDYRETIFVSDGTPHYCRASKHILRDSTGEIIGLYGVSRDITREHTALEQFRLLNDSIPGGIVTFKVTGEHIEMTYFNDGFCRMMGCTREEYEKFYKKDALSRVHPDDRAMLFEQIRNLYSNDDGIDFVFRNMRIDGQGFIWINIKGVLTERVGDSAYVNTVLFDVTHEREIELRNTELAERISAIIDNVDGGVVAMTVANGKPCYLFYNDHYYSMFGYTKKQFEAELPNGLVDIIHPDDIETTDRAVYGSDITRGSLETEYRVKCRDGSIKWIRTNGSICMMAGIELPVHVAVLYDITAQKAALDAVRVRETEYRLAIESSGRMIYRYDHTTSSVDLSEMAAPVFGLPTHLDDVPECLLTNGMVAEESIPKYREFFSSIKRGDASGNVTIHRNTATMGWRWFSVNFNTAFGSDGKPASSIITFSDITEQREKEAAYTRWQQSLGERSPGSYSLYRWNLSQGMMTGAAEGRLHPVIQNTDSVSFADITLDFANSRVASEDRDRYLSFLNADAMLASYYRGRRFDSLDYRGISPEGRAVWMRVTVELVEYPDSTDVCAYMLFENIDDKKRAELLVREQASLDPLTGVLNRVTFIDKFDAMISAGRHCSLIMLDLDGFKLLNDAFGHAAGDQALIDTVSSIKTVIRPVDLLGRLGGDEFLIGLSGIIETDTVEKYAKKLCIALRKPYSPEVRLSGSFGIALGDDGSSFDELYPKADAALYKVKGSGRDNYAFYEPWMTPGETKHDDDHGRPPETDVPNRELRRILITEDNAIDRETLIGILETEYEVKSAHNGQDAYVLLRHFGTSISAVLVDLFMPGMDGFALLEKITSDPELSMIPVIVVSGSDDRDTAIRAIRAGAVDYLTKPADPDIIQTRVRSAISRAENERLRAQNSLLSMRSRDADIWREALTASGSLVVIYDAVKKSFVFDPSLGDHISAVFDDRALPDILALDAKASPEDIDSLTRLASDPEESCPIVIRLLAPSGEMHGFRVTATSRKDAFGKTESVILVFRDTEE